jgi:DNA polymerase-4
MMHELRFILHIDLDAFYASIEQRDHPDLRGKPVIVGGSPDRRGVVSTASYEARRFGVHSAMPSRTAQHLCPEAIFLPPRFEVYRAVSQQMMAIFQKRTELVEPLSLVTGSTVR